RPGPAAPQQDLRLALPETLRRDLRLPASRCGYGRSYRHRADGSSLRGSAVEFPQVRIQNGQPAPFALPDGGADRGPGLPLQLLRNGLLSGGCAGKAGKVVPTGERVPRLDRVLSERQRYSEQPAVRQPASGCGTPDRTESDP